MKKLVLLIILGTTLISWRTSAQELTTVKGTVKDTNNEPLAGANVFIKQLNKGTTTDFDGNYVLEDVPLGNQSITASYIGYLAVTKNVTLASGENTFDFLLEESAQMLESVVVTAQKREEQIQDVPVAISVLSAQKLASLGTSDLGEISDFIPGLNIQVQSAQRPGFVIRGLTSDGNGGNSQPRVSVFYNYSPVARPSASVIEPYDLERLEVLKGPQGTLFGRGAQVGAVHFIPQAPKNLTEASMTVGGGSFNYKHLTAMVNTPLVTDKLFMRIAGTLDEREGFIKNTFGGTLNGKNTTAGRFSLRYLPSEKTKLDFVMDYQKDDAPGTAFLSKVLANTNGEVDIFSGVASFEGGKNLSTFKENVNSSLIWKQNISESVVFTSITSLLKHGAFEQWDGDGSAARAIYFNEDIDSEQFYQEARLNYAPSEKFRIFFGTSYFTENVDQTFEFAYNEQSAYWLFFGASNLVNGNGQPILVTELPESLGEPLAGLPLPENHIERQLDQSTNSALDFFADATYSLTPQFSLTGGLRYTMDFLSLQRRGTLVQEPSVLGNFTRNAPNFFLPVSDFSKQDENFSAITGRFIAKYDISDNFNTYASFARGRRPNVIQFRNDGSIEILNDEKLNSYDLGFKSTIRNRMNLGLALFYQDYSNFQTGTILNDTAGGDLEIITVDAGNATSYGTELDLSYAIQKGLIFFGNYTYIHARFDDTDSNGNEQQFAGNRFRLTPDHSFSLGLEMNFELNDKVNFFALPSYNYKSKVFFDDANPVDINDPDNPDNPANQFQEAYGIFNLNTGFELPEKGLKLTLFAKNIFDKDYIIDAGNTGAVFGIPTYVPGLPRFIGAKLSWKFLQENN